MVKGDVYLREQNEWVSSEGERGCPRRIDTEDDVFLRLWAARLGLTAGNTPGSSFMRIPRASPMLMPVA